MPTTAPTRSLLLLHGSGGSAAEFTRRFGASLSPPWHLEAIDAPAGTGKWWTYPAGQRSFTATSYDGAEESIAAVESELARGNHFGIVGFSQGAMLAAMIAARAALGEGVRGRRLFFLPNLYSQLIPSRYISQYLALSGSRSARVPFLLLSRAATARVRGHQRGRRAQAV